MSSISLLSSGWPVAKALSQIEAHPEIWNTHRQRTEAYGTPHNGVSDIWVRYNAWKNYTGDWATFHDKHVSEWYPVIAKIPAVWSLVRKIRRHIGANELGGVLITKIPPGGRVAPHIDGGWHAGHYAKYAVQLMGNKDQAFCFEDSELRPEPGDLYTFDNSKLHWVTNDSDSDRMTLIVCLK
jgi:aspartyl/asparaginyl beta-hydroxylase (cupin superfamily)